MIAEGIVVGDAPAASLVMLSGREMKPFVMIGGQLWQ